MYNNLNKKDIRVLEYLVNHCKAKGYPPSVREICRELEIKSTSTVFSILKKLEKENYIKKDPSKPRAIEILKNSSGDEDLIKEDILRLPVIGQIAAGLPILADENIEEYIPLPSNLIKGKNCFMLKVRGDSMIDAGILDNDYIIVDSSDIDPPVGKIVVALIENEAATVKTLEKKGKKIVLKPQNRAYKKLIYDASNVKILGSVTGVFRTF